jgi:hypothetical protein
MLILYLLLPIISWSISDQEISANFKYVQEVQQQIRTAVRPVITKQQDAIRKELAGKFPKPSVLFYLLVYRSLIVSSQNSLSISRDPRWAEQLKIVQSEFINLPPESEFSQVDDILKKMISEILYKDTSDEVNKILAEISAFDDPTNVPVDLIVQLKSKMLPVEKSISDQNLRFVLTFIGLKNPIVLGRQEVYSVSFYLDALNDKIKEKSIALADTFQQERTYSMNPQNSPIFQLLSEDPIVLASKAIFETLVEFKTVAGIPVTVGPKSLGTLIVPPRPAGFQDTVALVEDLMNLPTMIEKLRLQAGNEKILAGVDDTLVKILKKMKDEAKKEKADFAEIFVLLKDIHSKIKDWVNSKATVGSIKPVVPVSSAPVPTAAVIPSGPVPPKPTTIIPVKAATIASPVENEAEGEVDNVSPADDTDSGSPDENTKSKKKKKSGSSKWLVVGLCVGLGVPFLIAVAVVLVKKYKTAAEAAQSPV